MFQKVWYLLGRLIVTIYAHIALNMDILWKTARPTGPVILAANHPSTTDPAIVTTLVNRQASILINHILFNVPVFGRSLRMAGHIPVIHGNGKAALQEASRLLKAGRTIIIFPEGDISPLTGGMHKLHTGVARLAMLTGAPVIPVGISLDADRIQIVQTEVKGTMEPGTWYLHGPYGVTVGEPMQFEGSVDDREYVKSVTETIMQQISLLAQESAIRIAPHLLAANTFPRFSIPARLVNFGWRLLVAS